MYSFHFTLYGISFVAIAYSKIETTITFVVFQIHLSNMFIQIWIHLYNIYNRRNGASRSKTINPLIHLKIHFDTFLVVWVVVFLIYLFDITVTFAYFYELFFCTPQSVRHASRAYL